MPPPKSERIAFALAVLEALDCPEHLKTADAEASDFLAWVATLPGTASDDRARRAAASARLVLLTEHMIEIFPGDPDRLVHAGTSWATLRDLPRLSLACRVTSGGAIGNAAVGRPAREKRREVYERHRARGLGKPEARAAAIRELWDELIAGGMTEREARRLLTPRGIAEATREAGARGRPRVNK